MPQRLGYCCQPRRITAKGAALLSVPNCTEPSQLKTRPSSMPLSSLQLTPPTDPDHLKAVIEGAAAVIFDNDGTIVDSMPLHLKAYQVAMAQFGLVFPDSLFYAWAGQPAFVIIEKLKKDQGKPEVNVEALMEAKKEALHAAMHTIRPIEPVVTLLRHARAKGIPIAVASGGERKDVLASLEASGVGVDVFDAVVTCEDVKNGKPDPETFLLAAQKLGVDPTKCVGLEDGEKGLEALRGAGMVALDARTFEGYPTPVINDVVDAK